MSELRNRLTPRTVRPLAGLFAAVSVIAATLAFASTSALGYGGFSDVPEGAFYSEAVAWMADEDISTGTAPGCFSPGDDVTRGQAAVFLHRLAGEPSTSASHPFGDVHADWQEEAVDWLHDNGFTTGVSATRFAPERSLTRGEFAAFLYRFEETTHSGGHPFDDVHADWQQDPVAWLYDHGITTGVSDDLFAPSRTMTRAEVATMIWRYAGEPSANAPADVACGQGGGGSGNGDSGGGTPGPLPNGPFVTPDDLGNSVGAGAVGATPTNSVGDRSLTSNGAVLENVVVNGCIHVDADNVTIRNVIVNCENTYPVRAENSDNLTVEYSRINCGYTDNKGFFISDSNDFVIDRIEVTGCDDQMFVESGLGSSRVSNSVFHNQAPDSDAHTDGIQLGTFDPTTGTLAVVGNWWEYNRDGCCENAVMFLSSSAAITAEVSNNYLDGDFGTHLLRCHSSSRCVVDNNTVPYEPDGFVVHDTSSRTGIARCNRYTNGSLIPGDMFNGIPVDNSGC